VKKRVLQLIGSFHQGGSERQAVALSRLLKDDGTFDVLAATLNREGILAGEMAARGFADIPEYRLNSFYDANFIRQIRRCAADLRDSGIDIIHTHDFYSNVFGMAAAKLAGVPVRIASKRETGMRTRAQEFVEGLAFGRAHAIVSNSAAARETLGSRGFDNVSIIHNGTDLSRFETTADRSEARVRLGLPKVSRIVGLVANLRHTVKNIPMLLRSARRISDSTLDVHFVIAGEGELESELKHEADRLGVSRKVTFMGRCDSVPILLAASDVCVLTSSSEGLSNSLIEYMAAGKPVVATNVGGASEVVIEGETGFLVPHDDDAMLASRILKLLAEPDLARRLGDAGRVRAVRHFSEDALLANTLALYNSLLDR
jgi:L-malate glycosyltransferase